MLEEALEGYLLPEEEEEEDVEEGGAEASITIKNAFCKPIVNSLLELQETIQG